MKRDIKTTAKFDHLGRYHLSKAPDGYHHAIRVSPAFWKQWTDHLAADLRWQKVLKEMHRVELQAAAKRCRQMLKNKVF